MKELRFIQVFTLLLLAFSATAGFAEQATPQSQCAFNGVDYSQGELLLQDLKAALKANDKAKVADLVLYPVRINATNPKTGKIIHYNISNKADLIAQYHGLFTDKDKNEILDTKVIFCNYQGGMIGNVWFNTETKIAKIFAINKS